MRCAALFVLVGVACGVSASAAHAQSGAAALYASGDAALSRRQFADALRDCSAAVRLLASAPRQQLGRAEYCVAQAAQGLDRPATAVEYATLAIQHIESAGAQLPRYQADLRRAREMVRELTPRVPRVALEITPAGVQGLHVAIDGMEVPAELLSSAVPHDPGHITITAMAPEFQPSSTNLTLRAGEVSRVPLRMVRSAAIVQRASAQEEVRQAEASSLADMFRGRWWMAEIAGGIGYLYASRGRVDSNSDSSGYSVRPADGFLAELNLAVGLRISERNHLGLRVSAYISGGAFRNTLLLGTAGLAFLRQFSGLFGMGIGVEVGLLDNIGHGGLVLGGSIEGSVALTSGPSGGMILFIRPNLLDSKSGIIFALPLGLGYRWR